MRKCNCGAEPDVERDIRTSQKRIQCLSTECTQFPYNETGWHDDVADAEKQWEQTMDNYPLTTGNNAINSREGKKK